MSEAVVDVEARLSLEVGSSKPVVVGSRGGVE